MAENKNSFLLYRDIIHTVGKLDDTKAGILFKHILAYVNDQDPVLNDFVIELVFEPIKQSLKRDLKRWETISLKRRELGRSGGIKSGESRKQTKQNEAIASKTKQTKQMQANEAVSVIDSVSVSVIDSVIVKKKNIVAKSDLAKELFEKFRKSFPGTKRGLEVEFENFSKKNKPEIIELLLPALQAEILHKESLKIQNSFVPEWKNLSTWINQKCWTQELPTIIPKTNSKEVKYLTYKEMMAQCSPTCTSENFEIINTPEGKRWRLKQKSANAN